MTDFRTFTDVHPEFVQRCMQEIRVVDVNQQTLRLFRAPDKQTLLRSLREIFRDEMEPHFNEQLIDLWNGKTFQQREAINFALNGDRVDVYMQFSVLPGHEADWDLVLISLTDITARKKAEAYLEFLGKHDSLTKLRNRSYFSDEIARLERRGPWPVTVLMLDLNGLKGINDEVGHVGGDALLRRAGEVLAKAVDKSSCAARIGGDEFALLLPGADERGGERMAQRIDELVDLNNQFYGGAVLSFSIGAATCRQGERIEAALHLADQRMYAQQEGPLRIGRRRPAQGMMGGEAILAGIGLAACAVLLLRLCLPARQRWRFDARRATGLGCARPPRRCALALAQPAPPGRTRRARGDRPRRRPVRAPPAPGRQLERQCLRTEVVPQAAPAGQAALTWRQRWPCRRTAARGAAGERDLEALRPCPW